MKIAIMQPYFLPYIGYFQLVNAVNVFVVYDNIQYTKKGWINRNRILKGNTDALISLPIKKDSDYLNVYERELAKSFNKKKLLNQIKGAYIRAPYFKNIFPLLEEIVNHDDSNLFGFIYNSLICIFDYLDVTTEVRVSSTIDIDHTLKGQDKVLALCEATGADIYINAIGGVELYSKDMFLDRGVDLKFVRSYPLQYKQFGNEFCPWLSIVDVLMFNSLEITKGYLDNYELI